MTDRPGTKGWSAPFAALAREAAEDAGYERRWDELVDESSATLSALSGWDALRTMNATTRPIDAAVLASAGREESTSDAAKRHREEFLSAFGRANQGTDAGLDPDELADRVAAFNERQVHLLMNTVQVAVLELRVRESLADGTFDLPEHAVGGVIAERTLTGVDGYFYDENDEIVAPFHIEASASLGSPLSIADEDPDGSTVFATEGTVLGGPRRVASMLEVGSELIGLGCLEMDWFAGDVELDALEMAGGLASSALPVVAFAMLGAELAWAAVRGGDSDAKLDQLKGPATREAVLSTAAHAASAATGMESARLVLVAGSFAAKRASSRLDAETQHSVDQLRTIRGLVATVTLEREP